MNKVTFGNREGKYFTQWRFDLLYELLERVSTGPMPLRSEVIEIENAQIWYDDQRDFHMLSFHSLGKFVEVSLYKVFSAKIDGIDSWVGCPKNQVWDYSLHIRRQLGVF